MNPLKNPENSHIIDNVLVDDIFFQVSQKYRSFKFAFNMDNKISRFQIFSTYTRIFSKISSGDWRIGTTRRQLETGSLIV